MTFDLNAFRGSITRDFYSIKGFVNWPEIEQRLQGYTGAFEAINRLVRSGWETSELAQEIIETPAVLDVIRTLLAIPQETIGFSDGRDLPARSPRNLDEAIQVSGVLLDIGIEYILRPGVDVTTLFLTSEVARDAKSRRNRLGHRIEAEISHAIRDAVSEAEEKIGQLLIVQKPSRSERLAMARQVDYLIYLHSRPIIGIVVAFQAAYGGRQFRDLAFVYPQLQDKLSEVPLDLFVIADGHGIAAAPEKVLMSLGESVASLMTIRQASNGVLADEIVRTAQLGIRKASNLDALQEIIEAGLNSTTGISAESLPASTEVSKLALAQYVSRNNDLAVELSSDSSQLTWVRSEQITEVFQISKDFSSRKALELVSDLIRSERVSEGEAPSIGGAFALLRLKEHPILPHTLLVAATDVAIDKVVLKNMAKLALQKTPESKLALLVVKDESPSFDIEELRRAQRELSISVVVISIGDIKGLAQNRQLPADGLISHILAQSDLTKVSPFILNNATPSRMFYGREAEEATLLSTLGSNSVALLGGRRIGKTSLIRHVRTALAAADFNPLFGDCQTVRNWEDFGGLIERSWKVKVQRPFSPQHLFDVVDTLAARSEKKLVLFLDEIDQLLDWDQSHSKGEVSEALFKAFRTLSQEGIAQFVFSGERTIATKLWDPHSPHWNFCRPMMLRQLSNTSSRSLLIDTLKAMQISIIDEGEVAELAWSSTSGHPQIAQYLGDAIVGRLNERPATERSLVGPDDVIAVVSSFEFANHYLSTYWGQATATEKMISLLVAEGANDLQEIRIRLAELGVDHLQEEIHTGLRMLELYGIIDVADHGYTLRVTWFLEALKHFGGPRAVLETLITRD